METFGKRLRHLIKNSEYKTIRGLAKKIGFSEVAISSIVNDRSKPSYDFILTCLDAFPDVDVSWLITGESSADILRLENKQLKEKVNIFKTKLDKAVKLYSNRKSPQMSFAFK